MKTSLNKVLIGLAMAVGVALPLTSCGGETTLAPDVIRITLEDGEDAMLGVTQEMQLSTRVFSNSPVVGMELDERVAWTTSDASIVGIDAEGYVYGVSEGTAIITAKALQNVPGTEAPAFDQLEITCGIVPEALSIIDNDTGLAVVEVELEGEDTLVVRAVDRDVSDYIPLVKWSNSNSKVISFDEETGVVAIVDDGTATLTATSVFDADVSVTVTIHAFTQATLDGMDMLYGPVYEYLETLYEADEEDNLTGYSYKAVRRNATGDVTQTNYFTDEFMYWSDSQTNQEGLNIFLAPNGRAYHFGNSNGTYTFGTSFDGLSLMQAMWGDDLPVEEELQFMLMMGYFGMYDTYAEETNYMPLFKKIADDTIRFSFAGVVNNQIAEMQNYPFMGLFKWFVQLLLPSYYWANAIGQADITIDSSTGIPTFKFWETPFINGVGVPSTFEEKDLEALNYTVTVEAATDLEIEAALPGFKDAVAALDDDAIANLPIAPAFR